MSKYCFLLFSLFLGACTSIEYPSFRLFNKNSDPIDVFVYKGDDYDVIRQKALNGFQDYNVKITLQKGVIGLGEYIELRKNYVLFAITSDSGEISYAVFENKSVTGYPLTFGFSYLADIYITPTRIYINTGDESDYAEALLVEIQPPLD